METNTEKKIIKGSFENQKNISMNQEFLSWLDQEFNFSTTPLVYHLKSVHSDVSLSVSCKVQGSFPIRYPVNSLRFESLGENNKISGFIECHGYLSYDNINSFIKRVYLSLSAISAEEAEQGGRLEDSGINVVYLGQD